MGTTKLPAAFMASFLAVALVFLGLMPNGVHGKNMKFSRTLSFDEDLGGALKDLMGDLANSEKANKAGGQCAFECDNGAKPVKRKGYYPVSDGCMGLFRSVQSFNTEIEGHDNKVSKERWETYGITECCDNHDMCYGTCGKDKKTCDRNLVKCMKKKCELVSGTKKKECTEAGAHMEEYTLAAGCGEYMRLQKDGCDCKDGHKPGELPSEEAREAQHRRTGATLLEVDPDEDLDEEDKENIERELERDRKRKEARERKEKAANEGIPKMSIPYNHRSFKPGRYCAKLNAMDMFKVQVNLDVQTNNAFTFEAFLNGNNVVPKCRGNKYKFDAKDDTFAYLAPPFKQCYKDAISKYMLQDVDFKIHYDRGREVIRVDATNVPLINTVSLEFSKKGCSEGFKSLGGAGGESDSEDAALHDDSEL